MDLYNQIHIKHMRPVKLRSHALIEQVGRMYYILQMNQQEIAEKLGISRTTVVRLLTEGRELGIIQIYIHGQDDGVRQEELEAKLMKRYGMRDIIVARNVEPNSTYNVAARYIQGIMPRKGTIAISGGKTMNAVANYFHPIEGENELNITQLTGMFGENIPSVTVAQNWAEKLNANAVYLAAPGIVSSPEKRDLFLNDANIINTYKEICNAEYAITGIGITDSVKENLKNLEFPPNLFEELDQRCVGDIMFHFYDNNGRFNAEKISSCVVGATTADYLRIQVRIAVAFGEEKVKAIHAAMKGKIINIMITDEDTARCILRL
ncbi:putative transcriptional regulator [Dorea sp. D27]|nr:putative transcriptional regulator [Dorea sp. D27]